MIIQSKVDEVELSQNLKTKSFHISKQNTVHIVKILRSKLYSNKILAVIREYITNALDANAENSSEKPIRISLPKDSDPNFRVRDFGKGLSEKEINSLFISYGDSTKRESNEFTGCLGIGSKSAFAYSDSFTIISYHNNRKNTYLAFLDETGLGSLTRFNSLPDFNEETGIEIVVPVRDEDFWEFQKTFNFYRIAIGTPYVLDSDLNAEPSLFYRQIADGIYWEDQVKFLKLKDVFVLKSTNAFWNKLGDVNVLMGNVIYSVEKEWFESILKSSFNSDFKFVFKVKMGEIDFSSNRESIELTNENSLILKNYFLSFKEEYLRQLEKSFLESNFELSLFSRFGLKLNFGGVIIEDKERNKKFNPQDLELQVDLEELTKHCESIVVKALIEPPGTFKPTVRTLCTGVSEFRSSNQKRFQKNLLVSNMPLFVLSDGKESKFDSVFDLMKKNKAVLNSDFYQKRFLDSKILRFSSFQHVTDYKNFDPYYDFYSPPIAILKLKEGVNPEEFLKETNNLGYSILTFSQFNSIIDFKKEEKHPLKFEYPKSNSQGFQTAILDFSTKEELEKFFLEKSLDLNDYEFIRVGTELDSVFKIKVEAENFVKDFNIFTACSSSNLGKTNSMLFKKLWKKEYGKIPLFFSTKTIDSVKFDFLKKKKFEEKVRDLIFNTFSKFEKDELGFYFLLKKSHWPESEWKLNYSNEFKQKLFLTGNLNLRSLQEDVQELIPLFRVLNYSNLEFKDKKILKILSRLNSALSYCLNLNKYNITEKRKIEIGEFQTVFSEIRFSSLVSVLKHKKLFSEVELKKEQEEYFLKLISKLNARSPFLFQMFSKMKKEIRKEILYSWNFNISVKEMKKLKFSDDFKFYLNLINKR